MTKYRGVVAAGTTVSVNVAEGTPFRQMVEGEMLSVRARTLTGVAQGAAQTVTASLQIGRTVLFSGQLNQNVTALANYFNENRSGLGAVDVLFMGPLPKGGTISLTFTGTAANQNVLWEIGGEVA